MKQKKFPNALPKGTQLQQYKIKKVLGQGGFGITYLAKDIKLDSMVALKEFLPEEFAVRQDNNRVSAKSGLHEKHFKWASDRFLMEAQNLARFKHPNLVRVYNFFEDNNTAYMVMEYEEGESLSDLLKKNRILKNYEILDIVLPLTTGLEALHKKGIIHRDIKPDNIFIHKDGSPLMLDFGAARRAIEGQTKNLTSIISPGFSPFEQYHGKSGRQGPWSDVYALGAVIYIMMTGKSPVESSLRGDALLREEKDPLKPIEEQGENQYSHHLLNAVSWALQFSEEDRPQNMAEWREALKGECAEIDAQMSEGQTVTHTQTESITIDAQIHEEQTVAQTQVETVIKPEKAKPSKKKFLFAAASLVLLVLFSLLFFFKSEILKNTFIEELLYFPSATQDNKARSINLTKAALNQIITNSENSKNLSEKAIRIWPENEAAYINLGLLYKGQKKFKLAEQQFKKAIKINPYSGINRYHLGDFYRFQGEYDKAIEELGLALTLRRAPVNLVHISLGMVYEIRRQLVEAEREFLLAIVIDDPIFSKDKSLAYYYLAELYRKNNANLRKAIELYKDYINFQEDKNTGLVLKAKKGLAELNKKFAVGDIEAK